MYIDSRSLKKGLYYCAALILSLCASSKVFAHYDLVASDSSVNFLSTKNVNITESHSFDRLSGNLTSTGELSIEIDLTSVNTIIPIRNERMQKMLFNVSDYATATFVASIDETLMTLPTGHSKTAEVIGTLSIGGVSNPSTFHIRVTGLQDGRLLATTIKPTIINANDFELGTGLEALREIALLQNITTAVPLTFSVVFSKNGH